MNFTGNEVSETPIDHRYNNAERLPYEAPAGAAVQALDRLLVPFVVSAETVPASRPDRGTKAPSGLAPWQILRVRNYVESTLSGVIHVASLAAIAKLSTSHFARAFRASFGVTPAAYVVLRRVERAKSMMLETPESLCRISLDCGFTDQSHLSRAFRRQVGQSPRQWRRWNRSA